MKSFTRARKISRSAAGDAALDAVLPSTSVGAGFAALTAIAARGGM
jgi:hypothetical protein